MTSLTCLTAIVPTYCEKCEYLVVTYISKLLILFLCTTFPFTDDFEKRQKKFLYLLKIKDKISEKENHTKILRN